MEINKLTLKPNHLNAFGWKREEKMNNPTKIKWLEAKEICTFKSSNLNIFENNSWSHLYQEYEFLVFEGDTRFHKLSLDFNEQFNIYGIIIKGNLEVDNIHNLDTNSGIALVVFGDLISNNFTVGGQDIYITGNLLVKNLFMGDFNCGTIRVCGDVVCPIIILKDGYRFSTYGNVDGKVFCGRGLGLEAICKIIDNENYELIGPVNNPQIQDLLDSKYFDSSGLSFISLSSKVAADGVITYKV